MEVLTQEGSVVVRLKGDLVIRRKFGLLDGRFVHMKGVLWSA
jgi:hypothetical protein